VVLPAPHAVPRKGASPPGAGATFVATVIDRLSRRHPRIVFNIVSEGVTQPGQRQKPGARGVDLLIFRKVETVVDDQTDFEFLFSRPYVVAAGDGERFTRAD
jgi:DNA-binding transcriptional LysR family regulator